MDEKNNRNKESDIVPTHFAMDMEPLYPTIAKILSELLGRKKNIFFLRIIHWMN